eukprot:364615-Chlamydomonas_euryale.AAC.6
MAAAYAYRRDTRKWGSALEIGCSPICGASITAAARPHSPTAPAAAPEREDIDILGETPVKKRMILPQNGRCTLCYCPVP